jgi:hypothetical protein
MRKYLILILAFLLLAPQVYAAGGGRDLHGSITAKIAIPVTTSTDNTAVVSAIIDTNGYGATEFIIYSGAIDNTADVLVPLLEDCNIANCSDAATVTARQLGGTIAAASFVGTEDSIVKYLGYKGTKRYVRLTVTPGIEASAVFGAFAVQGYPQGQVRPLR